MANLIDWQFVVGFEGDWATGYVPNVRDNTGRIRSGTTIVSGLDLGHHDAAYVRSLGLSPALTEKLLPYVGKTGPSAVMAAQSSFESSLSALNRLNQQSGAGASTSTFGSMPPTGVIGNSSGPIRVAGAKEKPTQFVAANTVLSLELTHAERQELTQAVRASYYRSLSTHFDRESKANFALLANEIQTALVSLHWHTGAIWSRHHLARDVFEAAARGDWPGAVDSLRGGEVYSAPKYFYFRQRRRAEAELIRKGAQVPAGFVGPKEQSHAERVVRLGSLKARTA